jgi:hypothetical protein
MDVVDSFSFRKQLAVPLRAARRVSRMSTAVSLPVAAPVSAAISAPASAPAAASAPIPAPAAAYAPVFAQAAASAPVAARALAASSGFGEPAEVIPFAVGDGAFYSYRVTEGMKVCKIVQRHESGSYQIVGVSAAGSNYAYGRLPASFLIPNDDPQFDKEGGTALGMYGYMLNSRCWVYDAGLALLVFTVSGDYGVCREMMLRLSKDQNYDGSFNFSYDLYIG